MGARFLDDAAQVAFKRAIETIEHASAVEVVVAVRRRSGTYLHANLIVGALTAFAGLAAMLYASHPFSLGAILVDPFVVGLLAGAAVALLPQVKRVLAPRPMRRAHVERAARATFVERGIHDTVGRSGLLVYISWLEREVALVPDIGLARLLPEGFLADREAELSAAVEKGGAHVARLLERFADALGAAMPRQPDDINELQDALDSDEERV